MDGYITDARGCVVGVEDIGLLANLPKGIWGDNGRVQTPNYRLVGGEIVERSDEEKALDPYSDDPVPDRADMLVRMLAVNEVLTEAQIEAVPDAFRAWTAGTMARPEAYAQHEVVHVGGQLYRCLQGHTNHGEPGWGPLDQNALWTALGTTVDDPDAVPDWAAPTGAHDAYSIGDRVRHVGKVWESQINANTAEPGTDDRWWREVVEA